MNPPENKQPEQVRELGGWSPSAVSSTTLGNRRLRHSPRVSPSLIGSVRAESLEPATVCQRRRPVPARVDETIPVPLPRTAGAAVVRSSTKTPERSFKKVLCGASGCAGSTSTWAVGEALPLDCRLAKHLRHEQLCSPFSAARTLWTAPTMLTSGLCIQPSSPTKPGAAIAPPRAPSRSKSSPGPRYHFRLASTLTQAPRPHPASAQARTRPSAVCRCQCMPANRCGSMRRTITIFD